MTVKKTYIKKPPNILITGCASGIGLLTQSPDAVTRKLLHALESNQPKARYYVGLPTYAFACARLRH